MSQHWICFMPPAISELIHTTVVHTLHLSWSSNCFWFASNDWYQHIAFVLFIQLFLICFKWLVSTHCIFMFLIPFMTWCTLFVSPHMSFVLSLAKFALLISPPTFSCYILPSLATGATVISLYLLLHRLSSLATDHDMRGYPTKNLMWIMESSRSPEP